MITVNYDGNSSTGLGKETTDQFIVKAEKPSAIDIKNQSC
jgi:hypothetical protein